MNALSYKSDSPEGWTIVDCLRSSEGKGKFSPITFADTAIDENGQVIPCDAELINDEDCMTRQALDYIFWIVPNSLSTAHLTGQASSRPPASIDTEAPLSNPTIEQYRVKVAVEKTHLEKLEIKGRLYKHCSDHFGISAVIE